MDPVFTLPYSEFEALLAFNRIFKKKGFATLVPTNRQQNGFDFVVMRADARRVLRVQVKSSRYYPSRRKWRPPAWTTFWFGNFAKKYRPGVADLFVLLGVYPAYATTGPVNGAAWKTIVLALRDNEVGALVDRMKEDPHLYFGFEPATDGRPPRAVEWTRPKAIAGDCSKYLLDHRREEIARMLEK